MPIYEIEAPNGQVLEIEGDKLPTEQELKDIFAKVNASSSSNITKNKNIVQGDSIPSSKQLDLTPSGLVNNTSHAIASALTAPIGMIKDKQGFKQAYNKGLEQLEDFEKKNKGALGKFNDFVLDTAIYSQLPILKGGGIVKGIANAAIQGGIPAALETVKKGGNAIQGASIGTALAGTLQGLPRVGKVVGKVAEFVPATGGLIAKTVGRVKPETLQRAVQPDSVALDLNESQAQNLLMNTTESIRNAYANILEKYGIKAGEEAQKLRSLKNRIPAKDLQDDIENVFAQYQGDNVNPAINMTGYLRGDLHNLVESAKPITKIHTSDLPEFVGNKHLYNQKIKDLYKQNVQGKIVNHPESGDINFYKSGAGKSIYENPQDFEQLSLLPQIDEVVNNSKLQYNEPLNKVRKDNIQNFDILKGRANINGNIVDTDIHIANTKDGKKFYFNKKPDIETSELHPNGNQLSTSSNNIIADNDKYFNSISPIDLHKITTQVGKMVKWDDEVAKNYYNPVLEQLYGKYIGRLNNLSPALKQANKKYSDLMDFQKNEGIRRILNNSNKIDIASSALKNYNSTVTKGNTNRNIQDLERILINEGYEPFLNKIDDVNAAMDLLNVRGTGDSWLANLTTQMTRPVLKARRWLNQGNVNLDDLRNFGRGLRRVSVPMATQMLPLQGSVTKYADDVE